MKICLACSASGHLTELFQLKSVFENYESFLVTYKAPNSKKTGFRTYFVENVTRSPLSFIKNFFQSFRILLKERPKIIISTGAGTAVPTCYIGKLFGSKVIFIETFCMITKSSLSAKLVYPIADLFLCQWEEQLKNFGQKAEYYGGVF